MSGDKTPPEDLESTKTDDGLRPSDQHRWVNDAGSEGRGTIQLRVRR